MSENRDRFFSDSRIGTDADATVRPLRAETLAMHLNLDRSDRTTVLPPAPPRQAVEGPLRPATEEVGSFFNRRSSSEQVPQHFAAQVLFAFNLPHRN